MAEFIMDNWIIITLLAILVLGSHSGFGGGDGGGGGWFDGGGDGGCGGGD